MDTTKRITVRDLREQQGLTVVQMAAAGDSSLTTIYALEKGKAPGRLQTVQRLASVLQVDVPTFLEAVKASGTSDDSEPASD